MQIASWRILSITCGIVLCREARFRTGSLFVSGVTGGIKTRKQNIPLLGQHAQTITDAAPVFYFIPAKQEAESGVNAGDLVLVHLEEKSKRRQFEIGAQGLWRASSGITLTHQVQLFRAEENAGVYKVLPANPLKKVNTRCTWRGEMD